MATSPHPPPPQARAGLIKNFTGIDDPYEEPLSPEITVSAFNEGERLGWAGLGMRRTLKCRRAGKWVQSSAVCLPVPPSPARRAAACCYVTPLLPLVTLPRPASSPPAVAQTAASAARWRWRSRFWRRSTTWATCGACLLGMVACLT